MSCCRAGVTESETHTKTETEGQTRGIDDLKGMKNYYLGNIIGFCI